MNTTSEFLKFSIFCAIVLLIVMGSSLLICRSVHASDDMNKFVPDKTHQFGTKGKAILCPPSSDLDSDVIAYNDESTDLEVKSGHTPGFAFMFEAETLKNRMSSGNFKAIPELDRIRRTNTLQGTIGFLSESDSQRLGPAMRASDLSAEWYQTGRCAHETVVPLEKGDLFEVTCSANDSYSNILNIAPDHTHPMPEPNSIVVASCSAEAITVGPFAGTVLHPCRRVVVQSGFILDYLIQKENVQIYKEIDAFLNDKIKAWKQNCSK